MGCGNTNMSKMTVCGGVKGSAGCKAPRAEVEADEGGLLSLLELDEDDPVDEEIGNVYVEADDGPEIYREFQRSRSPLDRVKRNQHKGKARSRSPLVRDSHSAPNQQQGGWVCRFCGFKNRATNEICGGKGQLGCKAPREEADEDLQDSDGFPGSPPMSKSKSFDSRRNHETSGRSLPPPPPPPPPDHRK